MVHKPRDTPPNDSLTFAMSNDTTLCRRQATDEEFAAMKVARPVAHNMYMLGKHGKIGCGGSVYYDESTKQFWITGRVTDVLPKWANEARENGTLVLLCHPNLIKELSR